MRRSIALLFLALMVGCVGSAEPVNPLNRETERAWWQEDTAGVPADKNPFNAFVRAPTATDELNPWASFSEPELFTDEWSAKFSGPEVKPEHTPEDTSKEAY